MLDFLFAMIAISAQSLSAPGDAAPQQAEGTAIPTPPTAQAPVATTIAPQSVVIGQGVVIEGNPIAAPAPQPAPDTSSAFNMTVVPAGLMAEAQTPSGKFTTATEVKPILNATKGNWIAVRDYEGQDLLYATHLFSWRCGLAAMAISINDEPMQNWPLPACHTDLATPNAILEADMPIYLTLKQGAVRTVTIQIVYDDLSMDIASFARGDILIP